MQHAAAPLGDSSLSRRSSTNHFREAAHHPHFAWIRKIQTSILTSLGPIGSQQRARYRYLEHVENVCWFRRNKLESFKHTNAIYKCITHPCTHASLTCAIQKRVACQSADQSQRKLLCKWRSRSSLWAHYIVRYGVGSVNMSSAHVACTPMHTTAMCDCIPRK